MSNIPGSSIVTRPATIADVAKEAKVSMKTVSRVLNREPTVKPTTQERVQEAMKALGYRPNSPARMLASNRTHLIGLIYNASSSYINSIQNGALDACRLEHYDLLIHPCRYDSATVLEDVREFIASKRVDGLVLVPPVSDVPGIHEVLVEQNVPNVAISHEPIDERDFSVCTNDRVVCKSMVRHLAQLGHQRIAFVCGHPDHKAMADRYLGYKDGLRESKLKLDKSLVARGENNFDSGIDCGEQLLGLKERPTAIFCANDHMATGVMKVAHESQLKIPADVSIAGFDDIPLAAQVWPKLTTVRQPLEGMAKLAAGTLIGLIRDQKPEELRVVLDAELVLRQSTGPAPEKLSQ